MTEQDYIGVGVKHPTVLVSGRDTTETGRPLLVQSMQRILGETYGSRFFCRGFGSRINEILFEPNDDVLIDLLNVFVIEAITRWEKRAVVTKTNIDIGVDKINVMVEFRVLASNEIDSFVYPFYRKLKY